ncbi:energy-coupling factor transporter transmembrane protein EcfT [bacterium]|nr:energy-coupling factor transporter transmembrane protein EcfT [bacterium]
MKHSLYLYRDTVIHKLDPRTKTIIALGFFIIAVCFNHPLYLSFVLVFLLGFLFCSKSLVNIWKLRLLLCLLFLFSSIIWNLFIHEGAVLLDFTFMKIYDKSLLYSIGMGLRIDIMTIAGVFYISTTKKEEMTWGLHKLGLPYVLSFTISMAFSLVPLFISTAMTVVEAQKSRGLDLDSGNIFTRIKKHIPLLVPVFLIAIRNSNKLAMALESKGFSPSSKRSSYIRSNLKYSDIILLLITTIAVALSILLRVNDLGVIINRL